MPNPPTVEKAKFKIRGDSSSEFEVHFNPESLQYTITNNMKNTGSGNSATQYVDKSTGKLTMDLVFDTTNNGEDVRLHTVKVAKLMEPTGRGNRKTPPVAEFDWGLYTFSGMVESYKETIDFFSANGVPLRASVNVTLASQDEVFEGGSTARDASTGRSLGRGVAGGRSSGGGGPGGGPGGGGAGSGAGGTGGGGDEDSIEASLPAGSDGQGITRMATQAGNPEAARAIAASNGIENMRFPGDVQLELSAGSLSAGMSSMTGIESGAGGALAGLQVQASAGSGGAFAGLHAQASADIGGSLDLEGFSQSTGTAQLGIQGSAAISLDGQASLQGSASLKADVGAAGELKSRIEFDGGY